MPENCTGLFLQVSKLSFVRLFLLALLFQQFNVGSEAYGATLPESFLFGEDTVTTAANEGYLIPDTLNQDSIRPDTIPADTTVADDMLESEIIYSARDSMPVDLDNEITYLYGDATVDYQDLHLKAEYIMIDMGKKELFASGITDSSGNTIGNPEFSQADQKFRSSTIKYNFKSKKGKIGYVITQEGQGYIHGEVVKKDAENNFYIQKGQYTTCDLDTPHFAITSNKLKVIKNNKIVTGPAYMTIEGVSTPLILPFGFFPNKKGRSSGIIFPTFGESNERGFYFQNLGYYFGFSDYLTLALKSDIYSKGSYSLYGESLYKKRYKYSGNLSVSYAYTVTSEKELADYQETKDFHISWRHSQDSKVDPYSTFSANVNAGSANYFRNTISSTSNFLNNQLSSSIMYTHMFPGTPVNLGVSASHSQNTNTREIRINLPDVSLSISRINPFKRKVSIGRPRWYENIGTSYSFKGTNYINTVDSLLFREESLDEIQNGFSHYIPFSTSFNLMNYFNVTPSFNYSERWYFKTMEKSWNADSARVEERTVEGFQAGRDYQANLAVSTIVYGMYQFKSGYIKAIRHVMKPTASFGYRPDYSQEKYGYYKTVQSDINGNTSRYSIFEKTVYGGPAGGAYANLNFSLDNNIEMKVNTNSDTGETVKKVKIFESLSISGDYNFIADSMNLGDFRINGRTTLFDKVALQFSGTLNPYAYDENNKNYDEFLIDNGGPLAQLTNANMNLSISLNQSKDKGNKKYSKEELNNFYSHPENFIEFDIPFNLAVSYGLQYTKDGNAESIMRQTSSFSGDLKLTPKWKVGFNTWYDLTEGRFTNASLNFQRDLHCWEMRLDWIPFGQQQRWNFQINVKASILQDLKYNMQSPPWDNR